VSSGWPAGDGLTDYRNTRFFSGSNAVFAVKFCAATKGLTDETPSILEMCQRRGKYGDARIGEMCRTRLLVCSLGGRSSYATISACALDVDPYSASELSL